MLEIRANCEACDRDLPADSTEARICSFECTFCRKCVETVLRNVCPNCGGGFERRPVRPRAALEKYPAKIERSEVGYDKAQHADFVERYGDLAASQR